MERQSNASNPSQNRSVTKITITRPPSDYLALLIDLGITALWFGNETCKQIRGGKGKAWSAISIAIGLAT